MDRAIRALSVGAVAMVAGGCTFASPIAGEPIATPLIEYQAPAGAQYVDRWLPTPAVDLMSADGTFIRAFAEAATVAAFNVDKDAGSYPGYVRANRTREVAYDRNIRFHVRWIVSIESELDNWVVATVCSKGLIGPKDPERSGTPKRMKYHRSGTPPPTQQQGIASAPRFSVFGGWYATYFSYGRPSYESDPLVVVDPTIPCPMPPGVTTESSVATPGWPQTQIY
ncbi:hypothetical protein BKG76_00285 [Mycobacteroides franklinii]|uniref:Lipoprotein n=1 Tax=Mycobacteroides franklinii TaxID=948102 RepID=A0A1S1LHT1_9MYCO|nr:hypothetical protein [Mycobacteroides franklinii]OHU31690.1 hypothetical protein BKG76_00285 [Mycobacteroides franklinii]